MPTRLLRKLLQSDRERFLESLLESATDYAIITLDLDGCITSWNSGAEKVLGWFEAEVLGQSASLFFTPEDQDAEAPAKEMATAHDYGRATDERWHVRKGGERSGPRLPDAARRRRDRRHRGLPQDPARPNGAEAGRGDDPPERSLPARRPGQFRRRIKVLDLDGRIDFMNAGGLLGMEVDDASAMQGRLWTSLWEDDGGTAAEESMAVARAGGTGRFSGLAKTLKGTPRWWDVQVTPIAGSDGRPGKLPAISRDVTDRRQAESILRETVERYSLVTRATNDAIWDWDLVRNHIQWNEALYTALLHG